MYEDFTAGAMKVLKLAEDEARQRGQNAIDTEHLLLGLILEGEGVAAKALAALKVFPPAVYDLIITSKGMGRSRQVLPQVIPLNLQVRSVVYQAAKTEARRLRLTMVDTEHILLGLARENHGTAIQILTQLSVDREMIRDQVSRLRPTSPPPEKTIPHQDEPVSAELPAAPEFLINVPDFISPESEKALARRGTLIRFGPDLVRLVRKGRFEPVVGREREIKQIIRVLARRNHSSPLLVGEKGVGKTATIIGLAGAIATDQTSPLSGCRLYALDPHQLCYNVRSQIDLENRLRRIAAAAEGEGALLFIDDLDRFLRPDADWAKFDLRPALTAMLANDDIRTIGIVTGQEAKDRVMANPALEGALYEVQIDEPSAEEAVAIVASRLQLFQAHHNVVFMREAIAAAVEMAAQYNPPGFLPASALDLIDEVGSHVRVKASGRNAGAKAIVNARTIAEVVAERVAQRSRQRPPAAIPMSGSHITPIPHPSLIDGDPEIWSMV